MEQQGRDIINFIPQSRTEAAVLAVTPANISAPDLTEVGDDTTQKFVAAAQLDPTLLLSTMHIQQWACILRLR
jgi:hypothetical protein